MIEGPCLRVAAAKAVLLCIGGLAIASGNTIADENRLDSGSLSKWGRPANLFALVKSTDDNCQDILKLFNAKYSLDRPEWDASKVLLHTGHELGLQDDLPVDDAGQPSRSGVYSQRLDLGRYGGDDYLVFVHTDLTDIPEDKVFILSESFSAAGRDNAGRLLATTFKTLMHQGEQSDNFVFVSPKSMANTQGINFVGSLGLPSNAIFRDEYWAQLFTFRGKPYAAMTSKFVFDENSKLRPDVPLLIVQLKWPAPYSAICQIRTK